MNRTKAQSPKKLHKTRVRATAARKARAKKLAFYNALAIRSNKGESERASSPQLQAMYDAFIPERFPKTPSKFVTDKYGNRVLRELVEAEVNA